VVKTINRKTPHDDLANVAECVISAPRRCRSLDYKRTHLYQKVSGIERSCVVPQPKRFRPLVVFTRSLAGSLSRLARGLVTDLHPLRLAATGVLGLAPSVLDSEDAALDGIDQDVLRLEVGIVAPCAEEFNSLCEDVSVVLPI